MSSMPFCLEGKRKSFLFIISPFCHQSRRSNPFLNFSRDHLRSTLGITCGRGSFAVHFGDHSRSRDHLRSGITCGTVQHTEFLARYFEGDVWSSYRVDPGESTYSGFGNFNAGPNFNFELKF